MNSMPWMWEGEGCIFFFLTFAFLFSATPAAHGSFQVRASTEAAADGLHHSHSNTRSKPHLQAMLQAAAMPDP